MENEIIFLIGNAASGKSTIASTYFADRKVIDADNFKGEGVSHMESVAKAEAATRKVIANRVNGYVIDGTGGTTGRTLIDAMQAAQRVGFTVRLVYVRCDVKTCLERNAKRERHVPEAVIIKKAANIETIFAKAKANAHKVDIIETV